jgi:DNA-3-methyladenine glycosylase II
MAELIQRYGSISLRPRPPFIALSRSVIAQQISTRAADTIRERFIRSFGNEPSQVAQASLEQLRALGLTSAKGRCLQRIAERASNGDFDALELLSDEDVARRLTETTGVGPWTANMFLIFGLGRADIWPTSDAGLKAAARRLYSVKSDTALVKLGSRFAPYRSYAAAYLWKSLENTV